MAWFFFFYTSTNGSMGPAEVQGFSCGSRRSKSGTGTLSQSLDVTAYHSYSSSQGMFRSGHPDSGISDALQHRPCSLINTVCLFFLSLQHTQPPDIVQPAVIATSIIHQSTTPTLEIFAVPSPGSSPYAGSSRFGRVTTLIQNRAERTIYFSKTTCPTSNATSHPLPRASHAGPPVNSSSTAHCERTSEYNNNRGTYIRTSGKLVFHRTSIQTNHQPPTNLQTYKPTEYTINTPTSSPTTEQVPPTRKATLSNLPRRPLAASRHQARQSLTPVHRPPSRTGWRSSRSSSWDRRPWTTHQHRPVFSSMWSCRFNMVPANLPFWSPGGLLVLHNCSIVWGSIILGFSRARQITTSGRGVGGVGGWRGAHHGCVEEAVLDDRCGVGGTDRSGGRSQWRWCRRGYRGAGVAATGCSHVGSGGLVTMSET